MVSIFISQVPLKRLCADRNAGKRRVSASRHFIEHSALRWARLSVPLFLPTTEDRRPATGLRSLDQLHLPFSRAVQDNHFALRIAEDEHVAIAEMALLDRFFQG